MCLILYKEDFMNTKFYAIAVAAILAGSLFSNNVLVEGSVTDLNGTSHSSYTITSAYYTYSDFGAGTSWQTLKVGNLYKKTSSNTYTSATVYAHYNYNIGTKDKAYTSVDVILLNCYYDCFVASSGSAAYSTTKYGEYVSSDTLKVTTGNSVRYCGTCYY